MKPNNTSFMSFERARGLVKGCLYAAIAFCVIGLLVNEIAETYAVYAVVAAVALIIFALFIVVTCLKCPYCGKHLIVKCLVVKNCPHCGRNLETGIKSKSKKRK